MTNLTRRGRRRLGLLVPFTNTNLEPDMALLMPPEVMLHVARLGGYDADEVPDADQMAGLGMADLDEPLRLVAGTRPDAIVYGCTSATLTHGPAFDTALAARAEALAGVPTITAAGALIHALGALGVTRIGFASPYVAEINDSAIAFLAGVGVETVARADYPEALDNTGQGALTPELVCAHAVRADHDSAEALVLSCTDMRSVETIAAVERLTGKPVVTSNQALAFRALQLLGLSEPRAGFGALFERPRS